MRRAGGSAFLWASVRNQNRAALAGQSRRADVVNHARQSVEERLYREYNERLRDDRLDTPWEVTVVVGR